jgi:feruloyl esterase
MPLLGVALLILAMAVVGIRTASADAAVTAQCKALQRADLSSVQDAPTWIITSELIERSGNVPEHCDVKGYVAPQVGFDMRLPATWNGKFLELGAVAWGGTLDGSQCDGYLERGYACIAFDTGHKGRGDDGLWAWNNVLAQIDFGYRATHVVAVAGKAIAQRVYSRAPLHSFFKGCSTGGYEGLVEAQRFPWDFDGIIAGSPDMDEAAFALRALWVRESVLDQSGHLMFAPSDLELLHRAALEQCDRDDGVADGVISNPMQCKFDPALLACRGGAKSDCLKPSQVDAVHRIYSGPTTSGGTRVSTGGALPGSELRWNNFADPDLLAFVDQLLEHMIYGVNPAWPASRFNFDEDYKRFGLAALYTDTNPDLRKFKSAGGKLLVYQGANDLINLPGGIVDYVEIVERVMGGRQAAQEFFRLFLVPGMDHCTGGAGAYAIDYLTYLEDWVEHAKAPAVMIGAHVAESYFATPTIAGTGAEPLALEHRVQMNPSALQFPLDPAIPISFTRPVYPFPDTAVYKGIGDRNSAANFERRATSEHAP